MTGEIEELTKNLKPKNRNLVRVLEEGKKYILRFDVDSLRLRDVDNILRDIRESVPRTYNDKRVFIQLDGVVDFS